MVDICNTAVAIYAMRAIGFTHAKTAYEFPNRFPARQATIEELSFAPPESRFLSSTRGRHRSGKITLRRIICVDFACATSRPWPSFTFLAHITKKLELLGRPH